MKCRTFGLQRQSPAPCRAWPGPESGPGVPPSGAFVSNKPNFGRAGGAAGADCVKQSQAWKGWDTWARASRARRRHRRVERAKQSQSENSLKCEVSSLKWDGSAKQSQFRQRARNGKCLEEKELWWIGHPNRSVETKPISARIEGRRRQPRGSWYKQTQFPGAVFRAKQSQFRSAGWPQRPVVQQSQPAGVADCAKQTQFLAREISQYSTIPSFQHLSPMPIARNKANSASEHVYAKP